MHNVVSHSRYSVLQSNYLSLSDILVTLMDFLHPPNLVIFENAKLR